MPPKKDDKGKGASEEALAEVAKLKSNYKTHCTNVGITPHPSMMNQYFTNEEQRFDQIVIDDQESPAPLGPGGCRALITALLNIKQDPKEKPFKLLTSLRIWQANISDDGAAAIVSTPDTIIPQILTLSLCVVGGVTASWRYRITTGLFGASRR